MTLRPRLHYVTYLLSALTLLLSLGSSASAQVPQLLEPLEITAPQPLERLDGPPVRVTIRLAGVVRPSTLNVLLNGVRNVTSKFTLTGDTAVALLTEADGIRVGRVRPDGTREYAQNFVAASAFTVGLPLPVGDSALFYVRRSVSAPPVNPLDVSLGDAGALTLSGVSPDGFNRLDPELTFSLAGAEFFADPSEFHLAINGAVLPSSALAVQPSALRASVQLTDGRNEISLKAYDTVGRPLYFSQTVWAGSSTITVFLLDEAGFPITDLVSVALRLSDDPGVSFTVQTSDGAVVVSHVPSRTLFAEATSSGGRFGVVGGLGTDGTLNLVLKGFGAPSPVDNNDLGLGTAEGWNVGETASIVEHEEGFPAASPGLGLASASGAPRLSRAEAAALLERKVAHITASAFADNDLRLDTAGEGEKSLSRTFQTSEGTTSVEVRYRFISSEVPGGYFGTQYNDYFSVALRTSESQESESNTMNGLGLAAFDFASGATAWRTVKLETNPEGDTVQLDVAVANVADGLLDSAVVVDFIRENKDQVKPALAWDNMAGGLRLTWEVLERPLEEDVTIEVFWASGANYESRIGTALFSHVVPAGTPVGAGGPVAIPGSGLADDPTGATQIIAASSESQVGAVADVNVAFGPNANAAVVSAAMLDLVRDGLRVAGQSTATITSTARTPEDQARAMFNNLVNPANPVATNIANQLALYAPAGDAVIQVFANLTQGLTLAQINAQSAQIRTTMLNEINAQGPSRVSRHCADPALVSVVDVGGAVFNSTNGPLFVGAVIPRLSDFIDEIDSNNAYHLEL